jgi:hypothetical protein
MRPKASALLQLHANKEVTGLQSPPCAHNNLVYTERLQQTSFGFLAKSALLRDVGLEEVSEFSTDVWSLPYAYSVMGRGHHTVCAAILNLEELIYMSGGFMVGC